MTRINTARRANRQMVTDALSDADISDSRKGTAAGRASRTTIAVLPWDSVEVTTNGCCVFIVPTRNDRAMALIAVGSRGKTTVTEF